MDRLPLFDGMPPVAVIKTLDQIREELGDCERCRLHKRRTNIVFGQGNPKAKLMFIGEAPGQSEDEEGLAFIGRAGTLLTECLENFQVSREDVYIANIVKCRPPGNRDPELDEIAQCQPFLEAQIDAIGPKVIVALGKFAAQWLSATETPIGQLRKRSLKFKGIRVFATFHPAYVLRNPAARKDLWGDVGMAISVAGR
jgi:uracil-DNA glycosylase